MYMRMCFSIRTPSQIVKRTPSKTVLYMLIVSYNETVLNNLSKPELVQPVLQIDPSLT